MRRLLPPALEHPRQRAQGGARFGRQLVGFGKLGGRREQRHVRGARMIVQRLDRGIAQPALGLVDDALEGEVVVALRDHAQIGERVADFRALVETRAADHAIGKAERQKPVFEFAHLERGAHQHRHLGQRVALAVQILRFGGDVARFLFGVPHALHAHLVAVAGALGPQRLAEPRAVGGDQAGRRAQNGRRGAVIAFEPDDLGAGKIAFEAQDVFHFRAAPAIDRLVVVADHADILVGARQQPQPQILRDIGVLIFVHQHVAEAVLVIVEDFAVAAQDRDRLQQQIAEIGRVQRFQPLLVERIQIAPLAEGEGLRVAVRHIGGA